ncbi:hypothetical protein AcV7_010380 [Taiwanofungus camphoratus]|nr:hypothetical protein AcV7_010380 [Antrodia cinnamomea]
MFPRGRSGPQEKRVPALLSSCARCMQDDTPNSFRKLLRRLRAPRFSWCEYTLSPSAVGVVISGLLYHPCRLRNALNVPLSAVVCERVRTANASSPVNTGMEMEAESSHVMTVSLSSYIVYSDAARTVPGLSFT